MIKQGKPIFATILLMGTGVLIAQVAPSSKFEVASVKPNNSGGGTFVRALPGTLVMTNFSVRTLILFAYGVQGYQISGEPSWVASSNYDIQAKAPGSTSVSQMEGPMLQALLEDRLQLVLHRETRQLPVFELTLAKGGAKLRTTKEGVCIPYLPDSPPPPAPTPGAAKPFCGYPRSGSEGLNRTLEGAGVGIEVLASNLARLELHKTVVNKTGITGKFDVNLKWTVDSGTAPADDLPGPSIYTALQEQLGLRLTSAKGPVDVLVVDRIEKPSEN